MDIFSFSIKRNSRSAFSKMDLSLRFLIKTAPIPSIDFNDCDLELKTFSEFSRNSGGFVIS